MACQTTRNPTFAKFYQTELFNNQEKLQKLETQLNKEKKCSISIQKIYPIIYPIIGAFIILGGMYTYLRKPFSFSWNVVMLASIPLDLAFLFQLYLQPSKQADRIIAINTLINQINTIKTQGNSYQSMSIQFPFIKGASNISKAFYFLIGETLRGVNKAKKEETRAAIKAYAKTIYGGPEFLEKLEKIAPKNQNYNPNDLD